MSQAAHIAAEPLRNANNRQRFIRSPRQRDVATELLGPEDNVLDWNATAVGQNSTIALRLHPASSFGGGLCGLGKQSLGVEHSFRIRVPLTVVALTSTHHCTWNSFGRFGGCEATNVMSALGQKQTSRHLQPMSALPPKA